MLRIPFTLPDVGLREFEGIVGLEDGFVTIEVSDKLLGLIDSDDRLVKIEPAALRDVYLQKRPFKNRIVLVPKKRDLLDAVPGKHISDVRLRVWKTKRRDSELLVSVIREAMLAKSGSRSQPD